MKEIDKQKADMPRGAMMLERYEDGEVDLIFTEDMHFHVQRADELGAELTYDEGAIRNMFRSALRRELPPADYIWAQHHLAVELLDDESLEVQMFLGSFPEEFSDDELTELAWPFAAALAYVTDPGTFTSPYVFAGY